MINGLSILRKETTTSDQLRLKKRGVKPKAIAKKISDLINHAKINFATTNKRKYYFPEDIEVTLPT